MNFTRLRYFVKIVDIGSLTQAADILHIAQPALSQQLATLESELGEQLLIRTKRGVTPTEAGNILYSHAQVILRQCVQAENDVRESARALTGSVSVGLAPGTAASTLAVPLLRTVRKQHPGIVLYLNENFGTTLSELIMKGSMDMAVLYGGRDIHGLEFQPLFKEPMFLVGHHCRHLPSESIHLTDLVDDDLLLPRQYNVVRQLVDNAFDRLGLNPRVVAEIESATTLTAALAENLGMTILPQSAAASLAAASGSDLCRIIEPVIEAPLSLCLSNHLPLSIPAQAVKKILKELARCMEPDGTSL